MRAWAGILLLLTVGTDEARARAAGAPDFCPTFRRLLDTAGERPAFRSLGRLGPARAAVGLGFDTCRLVPGLYGNRLVCSRVAIPRYATGPAPERRIADCVPEALRMSEPEGSRFTRFRLGTLAFHVERDPPLVRFTLFAMPVER